MVEVIKLRFCLVRMKKKRKTKKRKKVEFLKEKDAEKQLKEVLA